MEPILEASFLVTGGRGEVVSEYHGFIIAMNVYVELVRFNP